MDENTQKYEREWQDMQGKSTGELLKLRFTFGVGNKYTEFLVDKELARRDLEQLLHTTVKAARWQAYFGIAGVIIGVVIARLLDLLK